MFNKAEQREELANTSNSNTIGKGTVLTGNIETYGNVRIEGKIVGDIKTKSKAACGPSSYIEGNVLALNAEVAGHITGTIEVSELLILKPSAIINGDIITNKLVVESGATFNGGCKMGVKIQEISIDEKPESDRQLLKAQ
jgi:cytoskeletal protein CcmA (bactofilin family)